VVWDAGERDGVVAAFVSAGEGQAQDAGAGLGVFVEGLVEVAHAEEEDGVGVLLLEMVELPHGGGRVVFFVGHLGRGSYFIFSIFNFLFRLALGPAVWFRRGRTVWPWGDYSERAAVNNCVVRGTGLPYRTGMPAP